MVAKETGRVVPHGGRMVEGNLYECGKPGCNCRLRKNAREKETDEMMARMHSWRIGKGMDICSQ